ncbi:MAG: ribulose-phosphate 3-epimerase [Bacteroidales bacterium]|nr:ribulose-phosphate 3-epimerase [Bacteroidales bacterium]
MRLIAPSILSADFVNLKKDIEIVNNSVADFIHIDIMDGVFVPNITIGIPVVKRIKEISKKPLDVHLMIIKPERYIKDFIEAGAEILTVHYEACTHLHRAVEEIKSLGAKAGVSLNPATPISVLEEIVGDVDLILLMTVNPGFGGQEFIESSIEKIKKLKSVKKDKKLNFYIEIDGGVNINNAKRIYESGVDIMVAGNAIFNSPDPGQSIIDIKNA